MSKMTRHEAANNDEVDFNLLEEDIRGTLREVLTAKNLPLYDMISYHFGILGGEPEGPLPTMKHGILSQLILMLEGNGNRQFVSLASALELLNGFLEVHDDVQSGNPSRQGRDALWWVWGPAQAINAGDGMNSLARMMVVGLGERGVSADLIYNALHIIDRSLVETVEGRFQDLEMQEKIEVPENEYLWMAEMKRGALVGASLALGALFADLDYEIQTNLIECGRDIGVASQINDDINEILMDRDDGNVEFLNKKKLFPLVLAMSKAGPSEKRKLGEVYFKRVLLEEDLAVVRGIIHDLDVMELCREKLNTHQERALAHLAGLPGDSKVIEAFLSDEFYGAIDL